jgi:hypothetical protein
MTGINYAVELESVDTLQKQWQQGAAIVAKVDQALAQADSRVGEVLADTAVTRPLAVPLLLVAIELLQKAKSAAGQLAGALDQDVAKLGQCATNYREAEERIAGTMKGVAVKAQPVTVKSSVGVGGGSGGGGSEGTSGGAGGSGGGSGSSSGGGSGEQLPPAHYANQAQVNAWINQAFQILEANGVPASELNAAGVLTIIEHESSGNPDAINLTDSNAAAGHPSQGLMQTIPSTFNEYKLPGYSSITDPVANIIAGTRYAISRYGSISNVPGVKAVAAGEAYVGY